MLAQKEQEEMEDRTTAKRGREESKEDEEGHDDKKKKDFETELAGALKLMQEELQKDVAEIYSPPRVTREAKEFGLRVGEAMDLTTGWRLRNSPTH